jgi:hypothetical protein
MKQGDTVTIDARDAADIAAYLRGRSVASVWPMPNRWIEALDPKPKVTDLSAVDYLAQQLYAKEFVGTTGPAREHAQFAVETIATWLRAANTNSLAAALILGENQ